MIYWWKRRRKQKRQNVRVETVEQINENNGGNQGKVEYIEKNNEPIQEEKVEQETVNN